MIGHFSAWKNHLLQRTRRLRGGKIRCDQSQSRISPLLIPPDLERDHTLYTSTQEKTCKFACVSEHLKACTHTSAHAHQRTNLCCTPDLICGIQVNICSLSNQLYAAQIIIFSCRTEMKGGDFKARKEEERQKRRRRPATLFASFCHGAGGERRRLGGVTKKKAFLCVCVCVC